MANQYVDKNDFKTYIGISGSGQDTNIDNAIDGASRQVDRICGRHFWQDGSVTDKHYTPVSNLFLETADISTATGLIVKLDTTDNGTHDTTLTINTDFILTPVNPRVVSGTSYEPYTQIKILDTRSINNVKVTAKFGFVAVPEDVQQATLIQALRLFKRKDTPFNVFGNEQTGTIELFNKFDPDAMSLLKRWRKSTLTGIKL